MISAPLRLLIASAFDYWSMGDRRTRPPGGTLQPRCAQLEGLLPAEQRPKVIGGQYVVHSFLYFMIGGLLRC